MRSSSSKSMPPSVKIERRGVANFSLTSESSSRIIVCTRSRERKISSKSVIVAASFSTSSMISSMPSCVSLSRRISRMALACSSVSCMVPSSCKIERGSAISLSIASMRFAGQRRAFKFSRASLGLAEPRIILIISSILATAVARPTKIWARARAFARSNFVRRAITSSLKDKNASIIWRTFICSGLPPLRASILELKFCCS